jgi:hypothetical protein
MAGERSSQNELKTFDLDCLEGLGRDGFFHVRPLANVALLCHSPSCRA